MDYYRDTVTQKSWQLLTGLTRSYRFVLIGGWAVWLYTKQLKSKDIDIVVDLNQLAKLKTRFDLVKNSRLKKYEFRAAEVQVDVYTPYYSTPGGLPAETILKHSVKLEGFTVPKPEILLITKIVTWAGRRGSAKGKKDFLDIIGLLSLAEISHKQINTHISSDEIKTAVNLLVNQLKKTYSAPELNINNHQFSKHKKQWLKTLSVQHHPSPPSSRTPDK
jgi:hypothetical protein